VLCCAVLCAPRHALQRVCFLPVTSIETANGLALLSLVHRLRRISHHGIHKIPLRFVGGSASVIDTNSVVFHA
jgi:hypothetical protein